MNESGVDYEYHLTISLVDAYEASKKANTKNFDVVVAVGGDGTINAVLNGFYNDQGYRISKSKFGIIYTGTSPDFCKSYQIPLKTEHALKDIILGRSQKIKIGKIKLSIDKENNNFKIRYFACCANVGLGAELARRANSGMRKYLGDFLGTLISLWITLFRYKSNKFNVIIDGEKISIPKMVNLSIGLARFIASGIKVNFNPVGHEDQFYLMKVCRLNLRRIAPLFRKVYSGKPFTNTEYLSLSFCKKITISPNTRNPEVEFRWL